MNAHHKNMNIRRLVIDVDKAKDQPDILDLARNIESVPGIEGASIAVDEMDMETVGMAITVEGANIDFDALVKTIEQAGAALHGIDEVAVGEKVVEPRMPIKKR
jgi:hypothetical protein